MLKIEGKVVAHEIGIGCNLTTKDGQVYTIYPLNLSTNKNKTYPGHATDGEEFYHITKCSCKNLKAKYTLRKIRKDSYIYKGIYK